MQLEGLFACCFRPKCAKISIYRTYGQGKGKHSDQGQAGIFGEHSNCKAQILQERIHRGPSAIMNRRLPLL